MNEYIFFAGMRIARRDSSGNVYYYFGNSLGSATITNSSGSVCYDADFYPFGGELAFTNTCSQSYKFAGMHRDSATGLDHTMFRQYSSNLGRWMSPDPSGMAAVSLLNPQSLNMYAYVTDNPTNSVDPLGLDDYVSQPNMCPTDNSHNGNSNCLAALYNAAMTFGNSPSLGCVSANEYGCGNSSMGDDIFDALGAAANIGEPTGANITVNQQGSFSVGYSIPQWMAQAGDDSTALSGWQPSDPINPDQSQSQFGCASAATCTAVLNTAINSPAEASTGALTAGSAGPTYNVNFPPYTTPLGFLGKSSTGSQQSTPSPLIQPLQPYIVPLGPPPNLIAQVLW